MLPVLTPISPVMLPPPVTVTVVPARIANVSVAERPSGKVNTNTPDRGPLLIIEGEKDHTVPWAIANAAYTRQRRNPGVTEIVKMPNRGHALTIDHGWHEVAETALNFVKRFT